MNNEDLFLGIEVCVLGIKALYVAFFTLVLILTIEIADISVMQNSISLDYRKNK
jgi:hypothetical protein